LEFGFFQGLGGRLVPSSLDLEALFISKGGHSRAVPGEIIEPGSSLSENRTFFDFPTTRLGSRHGDNVRAENLAIRNLKPLDEACLAGSARSLRLGPRQSTFKPRDPHEEAARLWFYLVTVRT